MKKKKVFITKINFYFSLYLIYYHYSKVVDNNRSILFDVAKQAVKNGGDLTRITRLQNDILTFINIIYLI